MKVSDLIAYLIQLERTKFTGQIRLNFHKGDVSKKVERRIYVSEDTIMNAGNGESEL